MPYNIAFISPTLIFNAVIGIDVLKQKRILCISLLEVKSTLPASCTSLVTSLTLGKTGEEGAV